MLGEIGNIVCWERLYDMLGNVGNIVCWADYIFDMFLVFWQHCLRTQVWRLRLYPAEKVIAAAKPLWFLRTDLKLAKECCQRIV